MDKVFEETKAFLERKCIANCGHNVTKSCIFCKIALCFKEIKNAEKSLQRLDAIEKGKNTDIIDNYMAFQKNEDKMSDETKYEFNVYATQLNKDLTNLMECLRKQDKDNKAILYAGKHLKKVILPYEEYQKMCQRLEFVDNAKPSEALEKLKTFNYIMTRCKEEDSYIIKFPLGIQKGTTFGEEMEKSYEVIHQALLNKSKKEQGFDIFMQILTSDVEDKKIMPYALFKATEEQFGKNSKEANLMEDLLKRWQNE